jgi:hypothetical protein
MRLANALCRLAELAGDSSPADTTREDETAGARPPGVSMSVGLS